MPIYERRCMRCNQVYSMLCKVEDRDLPDKCPACDCPDTKLVPSATRTTFKFADQKLKI